MRNVRIIGFGTFVPESYVMFGDQKRYRIINNSETQNLKVNSINSFFY